MKKLLILSDSHGRSDLLTDIVREHRDADYVIYLGDGERDLDIALAESDIAFDEPYGRQRVIRVCGNCDLFSHEPVTVTEEIAGIRVLITHGFRENVKYGLSQLARDAAERACRVALFGHTHIPHQSEEDGVLLFNPGSVSQREYGIMEISGNGINFAHEDEVG